MILAFYFIGMISILLMLLVAAEPGRALSRPEAIVMPSGQRIYTRTALQEAHPSSEIPILFQSVTASLFVNTGEKFILSARDTPYSNSNLPAYLIKFSVNGTDVISMEYLPVDDRLINVRIQDQNLALTFMRQLLKQQVLLEYQEAVRLQAERQRNRASFESVEMGKERISKLENKLKFLSSDEVSAILTEVTEKNAILEIDPLRDKIYLGSSEFIVAPLERGRPAPDLGEKDIFEYHFTGDPEKPVAIQGLSAEVGSKGLSGRYQPKSKFSTTVEGCLGILQLMGKGLVRSSD